MTEEKKILNTELKTEPEGFDLSNFAVDTQATDVVLEKRIVVVPVRKPNKQKWFKCHKAYGPMLVEIVEMKEDSEYFLVGKAARSALLGETKLVKLYLCYYQDSSVFICPVPQPGDDGKWNSWHKSLSEVVDMAKDAWVRAIPDKAIGGYTAMVASGTFPEPRIKEMPMSEYLKIAFKDHLIESDDHPLIQHLQGLV